MPCGSAGWCSQRRSAGADAFHAAAPSLKDVVIFSLVDARQAPAMPPGSTATYDVPTGSPAAAKIQDAMVGAPRGAVIVRTTDADGEAAYAAALPGATGATSTAYGP